MNPKFLSQIEAPSLTSIPFIVYGAGFLITEIICIENSGNDEAVSYKKNMENQREVNHRSEYAAFWSGCKTGMFSGLIDAAIWPIKLTTFAVYLIRKNSKS
jgi:hypothetical protein